MVIIELKMKLEWAVIFFYSYMHKLNMKFKYSSVVGEITILQTYYYMKTNI